MHPKAVSLYRLPDLQSRQAGANGMILKRQGRAEHRNDPFARYYVDRPPIAVDGRSAS